MKKLAVVTGSRAEYGQLRPFLRLARESKAFELQLVVAGMHLSKEHGETWREIESDGFAVNYKVDMQPYCDWETGYGPVEMISKGLMGFVNTYEALRPDLVLVEGDRIEPLAATLAAGYSGIPVAHGGGGDVTKTIDNAARHSISHFASIHFVTHEGAAKRLRAMGVCGEIHVTGGLGIDAIRLMEWRSREETLADLGLPAGSRYLLVAFHPESERPEMAGVWMDNLLRACIDTGLAIIVTYPNSDPGSSDIIRRIQFWNDYKGAILRAFPSLGSDRYLHALRYADALVGNSSSGLYEAPTLRVPVVNVGHRQDGRPRAFNVQDCGYSYEEIRAVLDCNLIQVKNALSRFESDALTMGVKLAPLNPYGDGRAAERIMKVIEGRLGE